MKWLADNWKVFAVIALIAAAIGYGEIRYRNGWYAHSAKVNADYALKKQDPNRTVCRFDDDAVSMRQRAIDAANNIAGFDEPAVQTQPGGKGQ